MIEPVGGHSGMHYYDFGLCRGLLAAGCRVSLYTCDETADPAIPGLGFWPFFRNIYGQRSRWLRGVGYLRGIFTSLRNAVRSGETICHFHVFNDVTPEIVVITMAKLFRRKVVLTVHDVDSLAATVIGKRRVTGWTYGLADRIIVHNSVSMKELTAIGVPLEKIKVIAHGHYLDIRREMPSQLKARRFLGIESSAKILLFFGQIKESKGLDLLIEALPQVAREVPDVLLLIAGRPWKTDFARYDALIDELNMREHCRLHIGFIPDEEVMDYYAAADLVVLPYRRIYQSGVLMMAMTYGRPVVVSDLPGMTEIVTDGMNGYVFTTGTKDELALVLTRALRDETGRGIVSARASKYIRESHDWGHIGHSTAELYKEVLSS
jgi:D-inositol-3-phosphate glycosyltransferase